jgi:hypothetical protein
MTTVEDAAGINRWVPGAPATVGKTLQSEAQLKGGRTAKVTLKVDKATPTYQNLQVVRAS